LASTAAFARSDATYPLKLSVNFTVARTVHFNGLDPATLTISKKGEVNGAITITSDIISPIACPIQAGSTDIGGKLNLTCSVADDTFTFVGTLKKLTGAGKGKFTDQIYESSGTYKATKSP
jgi:hypothetical protein